MAKQSSVNLDITNNADGFDISGGTTVRKLGITGGDVTIAGSGSAVVTFPTTSTTIAGLGITQSFSALQSFSAGISAAGGVTLAGTLQGTTATFSGDIAVNGGDITTTSTSATLFNANATTLDILTTQSSGLTLNIGTATSFSGTKRINIGGNIGGGASSEIIIGSASSASKVSILGGITLGGVGSGAVVRIAAPSSLEVSASSTFSSLSTFSQLLTANAGISASGATFSGNISAPNIVTSVNGATGPIINVARTTDTLAQFASTTSAQLASIISNETGGGGVLVFNTSPTITTSITTASTSFALVNTTATTLNLGGAATTLTMGGTSGTASIRNPTLILGNTNNSIQTNSGSTNYIAIQPYGNIYLQPTSTAFGLGSIPSLIVTNDRTSLGQVQISGGDLYLGTKSADGEYDSSPVQIIFEGATDNGNETTLTVVDPTADRTITFPDASGTVALTSGLVSSLSGSTYISVSGSTGAVTITNTGVQTFNGLTGAVTGVTVGGTNVFTALNSFNAGISASALTVSGGATFSGNVYLGDAPTGVTADSNDYVMMMGGTGSAAFKSGFYQTYKRLAGSTSGVICVTPAFNANSYPFGSATLEITISYTQLIAGPSTSNPRVHKIIMPIVWNGNFDYLALRDYTESITNSNSSYPPLTFTFAIPAPYNQLSISTTTGADIFKSFSGWGFRTTVQVH